MGWINRCFRGEEDLWKLVWVYGALLLFASQAVCIALRLFTDISIDSPASTAGKFLAALEVLYCIWLMVSLWRCAFNAIWRGWGYLSRFIVIVFTLVFCTLTFMEGRVVLPEEVVARSNTFIMSVVLKRLHNDSPQVPEPVQKKKHNFTIKVKKI